VQRPVHPGSGPRAVGARPAAHCRARASGVPAHGCSLRARLLTLYGRARRLRLCARARAHMGTSSGTGRGRLPGRQTYQVSRKSPGVCARAQRTRRAMTLVGIPEAEQAAVCALVAAVLHLGNVAFADARGGEASAVAPGAPARHLGAAAALLGVDAASLGRALTTRTRHTVDGVPPARSPPGGCAVTQGVERRVWSSARQHVCA